MISKDDALIAAYKFIKDLPQVKSCVVRTRERKDAPFMRLETHSGAAYGVMIKDHKLVMWNKYGKGLRYEQQERVYFRFVHEFVNFIKAQDIDKYFKELEKRNLPKYLRGEWDPVENWEKYGPVQDVMI